MEQEDTVVDEVKLPEVCKMPCQCSCMLTMISNLLLLASMGLFLLALVFIFLIPPLPILQNPNSKTSTNIRKQQQ
ncbi:hypothetical protein ERO13_A03G088033v2 [Gossypium hirsutum]|nr:hypothetical protein ERO13_A03G088033v2 [Gossypium hirsutum]